MDRNTDGNQLNHCPSFFFFLTSFWICHVLALINVHSVWNNFHSFIYIFLKHIQPYFGMMGSVEDTNRWTVEWTVLQERFETNLTTVRQYDHRSHIRKNLTIRLQAYGVTKIMCYLVLLFRDMHGHFSVWQIILTIVSSHPWNPHWKPGKILQKLCLN